MTSVSLSLQRPWELIWESLEDAASFRSVDIGKKTMWMNKHCRDWPGKLPQTSGAMGLEHRSRIWDTLRHMAFHSNSGIKNQQIFNTTHLHLQLCIMATKQKITKVFLTWSFWLGQFHHSPSWNKVMARIPLTKSSSGGVAKKGYPAIIAGRICARNPKKHWFGTTSRKLFNLKTMYLKYLRVSSDSPASVGHGKAFC